MKQFSDETRKRMSESAKKRCTPEWRKKKSLQYSTPLDKNQVETLYKAGHTQDEIAVILGVTQKTIWKFMKNNNLKTRKTAKRNQRRERNHMWKGRFASYKAFHLRLRHLYGKASDYPCSFCGTTDPSKAYDWANMTGELWDAADYIPLCRKCHRQYDLQRRMEQIGGDVNARTA